MTIVLHVILAVESLGVISFAGCGWSDVSRKEREKWVNGNGILGGGYCRYVETGSLGVYGMISAVVQSLEM